jgi:hypothetical protein
MEENRTIKKIDETRKKVKIMQEIREEVRGE